VGALTTSEPPVWIVDGMNVIGSVPDGWWRNRPAAMKRLVARLEGLAPPVRVVVVFDGRRRHDIAPTGPDLEVCFAGAGRGAADDLIVELVAQRFNTGATVVTSDHELGRRVGQLGAQVMSSGQLLERLADD